MDVPPAQHPGPPMPGGSSESASGGDTASTVSTESHAVHPAPSGGSAHPPAHAPAPLPPIPHTKPEPWVRSLPLVGLGLLVVSAAFIAAAILADPGPTLPLLLTIPTLFIAGKEAAIPAGIAAMSGAGAPVRESAILVAATMILVDVAATLVLYPVVHLTLDSLGKRRGFIGRMLRGAVRRADKRRHIVDRYGVPGLYVFAIIPFAFNGPPIVAALGRLAGLRAIQVVPVLVAAIVTTSIAWAVFYTLSFEALENVNKWIPLGVSLAVMLIMLGSGAVSAMMDRSEDQAA